MALLYLPASQSKHAVLPVALEYLPASQSTQLPDVFEYWPALHDPVASTTVPSTSSIVAAANTASSNVKFARRQARIAGVSAWARRH